MPLRRKQKRTKAKVNKSSSSTLLDTFSSSDLIRWRKDNKLMTQYQVERFFALQAQQFQKYDDLKKSLLDSAHGALKFDAWSRVVDYRYSLQPLSSSGSIQFIGGRFNYGLDIDINHFPVFNALYISENFETCYTECYIDKTVTRYGLSSTELSLSNDKSFAKISVSGQLQEVFDLTVAKNLNSFCEIIATFDLPDNVKKLEKYDILKKKKKLITTSKELHANIMETNWRLHPTLFDLPSNSQLLAKILFDAGFEAIIYKSTKTGKRCIAVFPQNLKHTDSFIELDVVPNIPDTITRLDEDTANKL